jgi:superfamily II DNA/RNA helicase
MLSHAMLCCADDAAKLAWLRERLPGFIDDGDVLCFVGQRAKAEEVTQALLSAGFRAVAIHGDMDQVRTALLRSVCLHH